MKIVVYPPLPRRVRARLWLEHRINGAGIWLCRHGRWKVALCLWRGWETP